MLNMTLPLNASPQKGRGREVVVADEPEPKAIDRGSEAGKYVTLGYGTFHTIGLLWN